MSRRSTSLLLDGLTWLVVAVALAPVIWLVVASLQPNGSLLAGTVELTDLQWANYGQVFERVDFHRYLVNSLVICSVATTLATAFATSAGYALSRFRFRGADSFALVVLGTQLIPGVMFLFPIYMSFVWLNQHAGLTLLDSRSGMVLVYTAFFTPVAIFLMRAFFAGIPRELEEAALVDGATPLGAFVRIVLPNAAPGILATAVYAFLFSWDELLFASVLTQSTDSEPVSVGIRLFIGNYSQRFDLLMAAGVVSSIPVLVAFFATQKYLTRGLAGALKG